MSVTDTDHRIGSGGIPVQETIVPVEQRTIEFYGDELVAVRDAQSTVWVPVRRLCEALDLAYRAQLARIERDPVLRDEVRSVSVTLADGRAFDMICLPLKYVRGWLFGVNANRVKPEIRDKLIQYQRDIIEIIDRHFSRPLTVSSLNETIMQAMRDNAAQQVQIWEALLEEQRRLRAAEAYLDDIDNRVSDHDRLLWEHEQRLEDLRSLQQQQAEALSRLTDSIRLLPAPGTPISPAQKAAIKALVDDIVAAAEERGLRLGQGRNNYPAVWDGFKRRFDLAKYDELASAQYDEALVWLKAWLDRIRGS
jgi:hypothetical protein